MIDVDKALQDMLTSTDFDVWFFGQRSVTQPSLPIATELLYRFCQDDQDKFADLCAILEQCFNAGVKVGESK